MNLVDTSGWIEYFFAGPNASFFAEPIETIGELVVPTICLYEAYKKIALVADESRALQAIAQMKQGQVIALTEDIALKASLVSIKHKLPMADSLIYATAQTTGAVVWTQDDHFCNLPGVQYREARVESAKGRKKNGC
jgi:predicted nucleic acid-binding protein